MSLSRRGAAAQDQPLRADLDAFFEALDDRYAAADNGMRDHVADGMSAAELAAKLFTIADGKGPLAPHYIIGKFTQKLSPLARRILPARWWEKLLGSYYR